MAADNIDEIIVNRGSGSYIGMPVDEDVARGDVVKISATNDFQVEKCDATGDFVFGVVANVSFSATAANNASGDTQARIWVGGGIVWAKVAVAAHTVGQTLTGGASGDFEAGTPGTHDISAVVVDATAVNTNYVKVLLK